MSVDQTTLQRCLQMRLGAHKNVGIEKWEDLPTTATNDAFLSWRDCVEGKSIFYETEEEGTIFFLILLCAVFVLCFCMDVHTKSCEHAMYGRNMLVEGRYY